MRVKVLPSDVNANLQLDTFTPNARNVNNNSVQNINKKKDIEFLKKKLKNYIIDPNNRSYYYWLFIFSLCYLYNLIFLIARTVFWQLELIEDRHVWFIIDYAICDFVYLIDILIRFRTGI
jgi:hypothetical protein